MSHKRENYLWLYMHVSPVHYALILDINKSYLIISIQQYTIHAKSSAEGFACMVVVLIHYKVYKVYSAHKLTSKSLNILMQMEGLEIHVSFVAISIPYKSFEAKIII